MDQKMRRRLERIESKGGIAETTMILNLIDRGAFYDELTDEQKEAYNRYHGFDAGFEALNAAYAACVGVDPSEIRTRLERRPTPDEQVAKREELAEWMRKAEERYNSPEEVAKRKAEYQELVRLGELRRRKFQCGQDE